MNKEIKEKIIEIIYETSAFGKKSERFQEAVNQILDLLKAQREDILGKIEKANLFIKEEIDLGNGIIKKGIYKLRKEDIKKLL